MTRNIIFDLFIDDSAVNVEVAGKEGIPSVWLDLTKDNVIELIDRAVKL